MKIRNIAIIGIAVLAGVFFSCKKDDETETKPSLSGMYFSALPYLRLNTSVTLVPTEVTHPDGKGVGYYWQIDSGQKDTVKQESASGPADLSYKVSFDSYGKHSVSCGAFADGYYASIHTVNIIVVNPGLGQYVTDTGIDSGDAYLTDNRDSKENTYYRKVTGSLEWMRNNLAYTGSGVPYMDSEVMSYPLGRYYTWNEAQTACPSGWRLPTAAEWAALGENAGDLMADARMDDQKMWQFWPEVKITNSTAFSAIPAGYAMVGGSRNVFQGLNSYALFWTADSYNADQATYVYIHEKEPKVRTGQGDKASFAVSVRCVR